MCQKYISHIFPYFFFSLFFSFPLKIIECTFSYILMLFHIFCHLVSLRYPHMSSIVLFRSLSIVFLFSLIYSLSRPYSSQLYLYHPFILTDPFNIFSLKSCFSYINSVIDYVQRYSHIVLYYQYILLSVGIFNDIYSHILNRIFSSQIPFQRYSHFSPMFSNKCILYSSRHLH